MGFYIYRNGSIGPNYEHIHLQNYEHKKVRFIIASHLIPLNRFLPNILFLQIGADSAIYMINGQ